VGTIFSATARCRRLTVHPHGRGDNSAADAGTSLKTGSPPRAWGQYETEAASLTEARFTPTGVGTMWSRGADLIPTSVHPHGRGDNRSPGRNCTRSIGSPPRAWGQLVLVRLDAYAPPVHPHGRGDNLNHDALRYRGYGSPPRAWGQCTGSRRRVGCGRFTPTGVGTMPWQCGAHLSLGGSPPRAWGQYGRCNAFSAPDRFTPTGVGTIPSYGKIA